MQVLNNPKNKSRILIACGAFAIAIIFLIASYRQSPIKSSANGGSGSTANGANGAIPPLLASPYPLSFVQTRSVPSFLLAVGGYHSDFVSAAIQRDGLWEGHHRCISSVIDRFVQCD